MRSGQQNKRGRGRNNPRKGGGGGGNPLSRSYDSNGPDVKIRGTAQHIAEKYTALARDALSASDNVMAENYLQHAEHYNRIVLAAQAQMQERYQRDERDSSGDEEGEEDILTSGRPQYNNGRDQSGRDRNRHADQERGDSSQGRDRPRRHEVSEPRSDEAEAARAGGNREERGGREERNAEPASASVQVNGTGPQPVIEGTPAEVQLEEESARTEPSGSRTQRPRRQPRRRRTETVSEESSDAAGATEGSSESGESKPPLAAAAPEA